MPPMAVASSWRLLRSVSRRSLSEGCVSMCSSSSAVDSEQRDVVVCGGGLVGLAAGLLLSVDPALRHLRVTLLEAGSAPVDSPLASEFSSQTCALSAGSQSLMDKLGVWQRVPRFGVCRHMQIWETRSDSMIRFHEPSSSSSNRASSSTGESDGQVLAYVVENGVLVRALTEALRDTDCEIVYDSGRADVQIEQQSARVGLKDGRVFNCSLVVGADGVQSAVRQAMGTDTIGWSYHQRAVVATLVLADSQGLSNSVAWQRYLPTGPLAVLPLSQSRSSLVWSTSNSEADRLLSLSDEEFVDALNSALCGEQPADASVQWATDSLQCALQNIGLSSPSGPRQLPPSVSAVAPGSRAAFPLSLQHSIRYASSRAVLIGDAAHKVHPMAGQGANLGFGDVSSLGDALTSAVETGADLGNRRHLRRYEMERQRAAAPVLSLTDALHRMYSSQMTPVVLLRSLGLQVCDAVAPVRNLLMRQARA